MRQHPGFRKKVITFNSGCYQTVFNIFFRFIRTTNGLSNYPDKLKLSQ